MLKNRERLAWLVLILAFALFLVTVTAVPVAGKRIIDEHTTVHPARLDIVRGTVLVQRVGTPGEQSAKDGMSIDPGDVVRTAGDARAIVWLFDQSNVELGPDSTISVGNSFSTTFSDAFSAISLHLAGGRPNVNVALPGTRQRQFRVEIANASLDLEEGSYELDLAKPDLEEAIVRVGRALASSLGTTIALKTGQRVEIAAGSDPVGPLTLERNLVKNGDFSIPVTPNSPLGDHWRGDQRRTEGQLGTVMLVPDAEGNYLQFRRLGSGHGENYAVQMLDLNVSQYHSLKLSAELRLVQQSLGGGGVAGTEFPVHIRLIYQDVGGRERRFETGFYYQNPEGHPTSSAEVAGQLTPQNVWIPFEVDLMRLDTSARPVHLIYLEIAASGWDYESHVRNVQILAE